MSKPTLSDHLDPQRTPKRILCLDGGGIRGMISLGVLERIEECFGSPLSDHFDLIGGTSTGALIAAKLATGCSVAEVIEIYERLGASVFGRNLVPARYGVLRAKFETKALRVALEQEFGAMKLGSDQLLTGVAIVAKRLDTGSVWVLHNNPGGVFYEPGPQGGSANKNLHIQQLLLASTAALHYFDPVHITVGIEGEAAIKGLFVDGGVSPHNNPSLLMLMLATLEGYRFDWQIGADRLQVVSIGTGTWNPKTDPSPGVLGRLTSRIAAAHAMKSLVSMMYDASALNELILQWLSDSPTARHINSEVGDLRGDVFGRGTHDPEALAPLSYLRYDAPIEFDWLTRNLPSLSLSKADVDRLRKMDRPESLKVLREIGQAAGDLVKPEHFELGDPSS